MSVPEDAIFQAKDPFVVTPAMKEAYDKFGFILVKGLLCGEEVGKLRTAAENPDGIIQHRYGRDDGTKRPLNMTMWRHPGTDVTGVTVSLNKVAGTLQELMGGEEIYHYHSKLMMKQAKTGGAKTWHQDYGYWYYNGCLLPEMASVFIPIDDCSRENGCLQVLTGSHRMGRIDHVTVEEQYSAEPTRLKFAMDRFPLHFVEMKAGDLLFFDSNLLHASSQNDSEKRRFVLIASFNKKSNNPVIPHHHPQYSPLNLLDDSALMKCQNFNDFSGKEFNHPNSEGKPGKKQ